MDQSANSWIGKRIGQYVIQSLIQKGGMAHVYYAIDQALERPVALKILFSELTEDASFVERFRREARSVAKLRHPNIVQIYTTGITPEGQNYIAMEYISGGSLREQLQQLNSQGHVLQTEDAINITRQVAAALSVAHKSGIIHRDIKPSNILLRSDGTPVVTDLGIAKIQSEATLTKVDEIVGTPYYMSPEQVSSKPVDARSDLYSLGMILYEMLTGQRVFTGDTPWSILSKHITETPKPITDLRPDISPQTANVVHTCLQKDPASRYQSTNDLITGLDFALSSEKSGQTTIIAPVASTTAVTKIAPPPTYAGTTRIAQPTEMPAPAKKKRPLWLIALLLLLVLLCVGGGTAVFFLTPLRGIVLGNPTPDTPQENTATATIEPRDPPTETSEPEEETVANAPTETPELPEPTETATATSEPTRTPKPTATDKATNTPRPTASPTPKPSNTPGNPTGGSGFPMGFDSFGTWIRGNEPNGSFTQSTTQAHSGSSSGKISYDFTSDDNDYVVFMQSNPIAGEPTALQIWVYGDGKGHYLNAWILDREGQTWQVPFGKINHTGWKQMTGYIDTSQDWPWQHISGPKNDKVDYPISFRGFVLDDTNNAFNDSGDIYLDDFTTANIAYTGSSTTEGDTGDDEDSGSDSDDDATTVDPGSVGRILYTSGDTVLTTDPSWSSPQELGSAASNTCGSPATTVTGESYNLYYGLFCNITGGIDVCPSPNGLYEVVVNGWVEDGSSISIRPPGTEDYTFVYQGSLDEGEGIRWSPTSDSFLFVTGDTINRAFPGGNYNQLVSPAYTPIFSQDGSMILYLKPIGPGVKDVFVSNSDGSNARNVTNVTTIDKRCHAWRQ
ncbi:MAG: protein kinase [Aquificales bacterium]|nr:protein kinase [Aquificales bacterium]